MSVLGTSAEHIYHSLLHLERADPPDDSPASVAAGKKAQAFVVAQRAAIVAALDLLDHGRQTRVSSLCREVMAAPECSFVSVGQWGVCALSGRTVNSMLRVGTPARTVDLDSKFASFVMSLWQFWHMSVLEQTRMEKYLEDSKHDGELPAPGDGTPAQSEGETRERRAAALAYAEALRVVLDTFTTTLESLRRNRDAAADRG